MPTTTLCHQFGFCLHLEGVGDALDQVSVQQSPPEEGVGLCRVGASPELGTVPCPPLWEADLSQRYLLVVPLSSNLISVPSYLANDMEEDDEAPKQKIFYFLYGKTRSHIPLFHKRRFQLCRSMTGRARENRSQIALFHKLRFQFCSMRCRAWVSPEELEEIQAYDPQHWVWARDRARLF
ncbi:putative speedy protein E7 [Symphalangus syndactylus]|uniref:putative speedy protein E7 n=1 Tax=Symphalangus syndactylus TaxID=9590 RepID=UPI003005A0BE